MNQRHKHYWVYPHAVWSGLKNQTLVARYCECGAMQTAYAKSWRAANRKRDPDILAYLENELRKS